MRLCYEVWTIKVRHELRHTPWVHLHVFTLVVSRQKHDSITHSVRNLIQSVPMRKFGLVDFGSQDIVLSFKDVKIEMLDEG